MKYASQLTAALMMAVVLVGQYAQAQDATPSVDEIVKKTNHVAYYQGKDGRARVKMTITDKQGNTREREFTILRRNMDENDG
ncbi:MAG TPA: outer membrane lipoprotein-sorting protein, partial [Candidatus Hydrogenedentes bacterium]|nr:outer membrane lipoprotein-sorting protein [Candidatus Hydrogenedentota bacterium]